MTPIRIALESPLQAEVAALVEALDAFQKPLYPAGSHHGVDLAALAVPQVLFAVARAGDRAVACGGLLLTPGHGELKRMYVLPAWRGRGVAGRLLAFLELQAAERGCRRFTLETGFLQHEALALYEKHGYDRCGPFGDYAEDPNSVFMRKEEAP